MSKTSGPVWPPIGGEVLRWAARLIPLVAIVMSLSGPTLSAPGDAIARGDYGAALAAHPADRTLWARWIAASLRAGHSEESMALIARAGEIDGWTAARRSELADLSAASDPIGAAAFTRGLLDGSVRDVPRLQSLIALDLRLADWSEARALLKRLIIVMPDDALAHYQLAVLIAPDDPSMAATYMELAAHNLAVRARATAIGALLSASPAASTLIKIGLRLTVDSQWSLARFILNRVLAIDPDNAVATALSGVIADARGLDGWPLIQSALVRAPGDPVVNYAAAMHWRAGGDLDTALAALAKAEAGDPTNPAIAAEIGSIYRLRDRLADALTWLTLAIRLAPNEPNFWALLGAFYADEQYQLDNGGLIMLQQGARNFSTNAEIRACFGEGLLVTGQNAAAQIELNHALDLDAANPRARYYLGVALESTGDLARARAAYRYLAQNVSPNAFTDRAVAAVARLG